MLVAAPIFSTCCSSLAGRCGAGDRSLCDAGQGAAELARYLVLGMRCLAARYLSTVVSVSGPVLIAATASQSVSPRLPNREDLLTELLVTETAHAR